jgi:hypothetical protein
MNENLNCNFNEISTFSFKGCSKERKYQVGLGLQSFPVNRYSESKYKLIFFQFIDASAALIET